MTNLFSNYPHWISHIEYFTKISLKDDRNQFLMETTSTVTVSIYLLIIKDALIVFACGRGLVPSSR